MGAGGAAGEMKTLLPSGCVLKQQSDAEFESSLCCSEGGHPARVTLSYAAPNNEQT